MKLAIPLAEGKLTAHFGHCRGFALVDANDGAIKGQEILIPPPHEPGVLPKWLHDMGANVIIAGGMGQSAQQLFIENGIEVVIGAPVDTPEALVESYLNGSLLSGENICDH